MKHIKTRVEFISEMLDSTIQADYVFDLKEYFQNILADSEKTPQETHRFYDIEVEGVNYAMDSFIEGDKIKIDLQCDPLTTVFEMTIDELKSNMDAPLKRLIDIIETWKIKWRDKEFANKYC